MTRPTLQRCAVIVCLLALSAGLGGCSKCGWLWDDWRKPGACKPDIPR